MANPKENRKAARDAQATWLKASRVATEMDVSVRTVKTWIEQGKVEAIRLTPNGEWRISRSSLTTWQDSLKSRCFAPTPARTTFDCDHPKADEFEVVCPICGALRTDERRPDVEGVS